MTTVLTNQTPSKEEIEKISSWVMIRWLSNNQKTCIPANIINLNDKIPIWNQYKFLDDYFKLIGLQNKRLFIKYPKNEEKKNLITENIQKYYQVNQTTAEQYYRLMDKKERERFRDLYKEGKV